MPESVYRLISLDLPAVLTALFSAAACALLGNFLVLRRLSLMGDAISHSVLPGIVIAFLLTGSRASLPVFLGATAAGVITAILIEVVQKLGRIESSAAMGVIFSIFFALGVILIEQASARSVDLDTDCLLHGQLESIFWFPPKNISQLFTWNNLHEIPSELISSFLVFFASVGFMILFFKELALSSFDPQLASALGFRASLLHYLLMVWVAAAVVASFRSVGSILVISMLICPAAIARLYTDKLSTQIVFSLVITFVAVTVGYVLAGFGPFWVGYQHSLNAAGMMAVVLGILLGISVIGAPNYGIIAKYVRQAKLRLQVYKEDILGFLYRLEESSNKHLASKQIIFSALGGGLLLKYAFRKLLKKHTIQILGPEISLTEKGRKEASSLIRTHRLWELYLVDKMGIQATHAHASAEQLEHFTRDKISHELENRQQGERDPHGKPIPPGR